MSAGTVGATLVVARQEKGHIHVCGRPRGSPLLIRGCICSPPSGTPVLSVLSAGYARPVGARSPAVKHGLPPSGTSVGHGSPPSGTPSSSVLSAGYARPVGARSPAVKHGLPPSGTSVRHGSPLFGRTRLRAAVTAPERERQSQPRRG